MIFLCIFNCSSEINKLNLIGFWNLIWNSSYGFQLNENNICFLNTNNCTYSIINIRVYETSVTKCEVRSWKNLAFQLEIVSNPIRHFDSNFLPWTDWLFCDEFPIDQSSKLTNLSNLIYYAFQSKK